MGTRAGCVACKRNLQENAFTSTQWLKYQKSRCMSCVEKDPHYKNKPKPNYTDNAYKEFIGAASKKIMTCVKCGKSEPEVTFSSTQRNKKKDKAKYPKCTGCAGKSQKPPGV